MLWSLAVVVVVVLVGVVGASEYRLPGDVVPSHYDLRLTYDIDPNTNFSFYGVVAISLTARKSTSKIVLHAQDMQISSKDVSLSGQKPIKVEGVSLKDTYNFLSISLGEALQEGHSYRLTIPFSGNLKKGLDGVYISTYTLEDSDLINYLITTQFEAISARKGFPCFDEPGYKATFSINIGHDKGYMAISNMPLAESSSENALEKHWPWSLMGEKFRKPKSQFMWKQFEKSVPMSTYLVAFVVSNFTYVEGLPELSNTSFRIWAKSDVMNQAAYAATVGPKVLSYFEEYYNVSFPLPKQDMIAIPDFASSAMENWGLITYREVVLLYDKRSSSLLSKERIAKVIAHELAHQWFGNLVTMKWWSDIWLNEGFATFASSHGVAAAEPGWRADRLDVVNNALAVLASDALESSHPVSVEIKNPQDISQIFDDISYRKGSALIHMMSKFLGENVFKKALHNYLLKYSYSNAEQDDLWAELTAVNKQEGNMTRNVTVKEVMDTWTKQTGYPLLNVTRDYDTGSLTVTQKRFRSIGSRQHAESAEAWWVPLNVLCETDERLPPVKWLAKNEGVSVGYSFEHGAKPEHWVIFNYDMIAPCRVNYDERNWQLISEALRGPGLSRVPVLARVQLLADAFALAWRGQLSYSIPLQLSSYLENEKEYLPFLTVLSAFSEIQNMLKKSSEYGAFQKYMRRMIGQAYERAGGLAAKHIRDETNLTSVIMQVTISSWACRVKVPGCEENAIELYNKWMEMKNPDENNPVPLDLRSTVYCVAVRRGSVREWSWAMARRHNARSSAAKQQLMHGLTCSNDMWILARLLEWAISDTNDVRLQDASQVFSSIISTSVGYYVAKDFIYNRIDVLAKAFAEQKRNFGHIMMSLLKEFTTQKELDEFKKWREVNAKYLDGAEMFVSQGMETAQVNINWINSNKNIVVEKLREYPAKEDWNDVDILTRKKSYKGGSISTATESLLCLVMVHVIILIV